MAMGRTGAPNIHVGFAKVNLCVSVTNSLFIRYKPK